MADIATAGRPAGFAAWLKVSADRPCLICGKPDWCCRMSTDGNWADCYRMNNGRGVAKTDKAGITFYRHRLTPFQPAAAAWAPPRYSLADGKGERAGPDVLDRVYRLLLDNLPLIVKHRNALAARGFKGDAKAAGYRTLGKSRATAVQAVIAAGLEKELPHVPGSFIQEKEGRRYWTLAGAGGLLIPVRDVQGRIVALIVRKDEGTPGPKYCFLTSKSKGRGGPGPGAPVHVPLHKTAGDLVRVTEGALKADIATALSGTLTIGLPSVGGWRRAAAVLRELGAKEALASFDADAKTNPQVAQALKALVEHLRAEGFPVRMERWDLADGKGIDDLLAAGRVPELLAGDAVDQAVAEAVQAAAEAAPQKAAGQDGQAAGGIDEEEDDPHALARAYLKARASHPGGRTLAFWHEQFWQWNQRKWAVVPEAEVRSRLTAFAKAEVDSRHKLLVEFWDGEKGPPKVSKITVNLVSNLRQALTGEILLTQDVAQPSWIGEPDRHRDIIAVANGLLDVRALLEGRADVLLPHSPAWFSPVCLPYAFDPSADCPKWRAFMARNLAGSPAKAELLQRFAGYLLLPDTSLQRFLMLVGEGANGKSVFCAALRALLGEENVSTVPLELFGGRFQLLETLGKLANIIPEMGEVDRVAEGQLKALVTGDAIQFEPKFCKPFSAVPTARLVIATNNPPQFSDKSDGLWRRMLLVKLTVQIPEAERVAGMDSAEFWRREGELPGILNWALAGLALLRQDGRFKVPADCQQDAEDLRTDSNPARRFLLEHYQAGPGEIPSADIYRAYKQWCDENNHHALASVGFGREMTRTFPEAKRVKHGPAGARYYAYTGLIPRQDEPSVSQMA